MDQHCDPERPHRRIALIAHDNKKRDMREWARYNRRRRVVPPPPIGPRLVA